jgi:methylase of polypeptide subunit release factors
MSLHDLSALGLIRIDGEHVVATCRLVPTGDFIVACDRRAEKDTRSDMNHVLGLGRSTLLLANLVWRREAEKALDLCCGGGIQSLLCASHSARVIACDINVRALQYARFNAALNDVANIEFRQGDLFAPISEENFDLIVANPPYVITPSFTQHYRDSSLRGDEVSRAAVRGAAMRLSPGGLAYVMVEFGRRQAADLLEPVRRAVEGLGCDAWFLRLSTAHAEQYVTAGLAEDKFSDGFEISEARDRWLRYLAGVGMDAIDFGAVIVRRTDRKPWLRMDSVARPWDVTAGRDIAGFLATQDLITATEPVALLDHVVAVRKHRLVQRFIHDGTGYALPECRAERDEGIPLGEPVDPLMAQLLLRLDGQRHARTIVQQMHDEIFRVASAEETFLAAAHALQRLIGIGIVEVLRDSAAPSAGSRRFREESLTTAQMSNTQAHGQNRRS